MKLRGPLREIAMSLAMATAACSSANGGAADGGSPPEAESPADSPVTADVAPPASEGGSSNGAMCGPFANGSGGPGDAGTPVPSPTMTFFVSSEKNMTGNLGGIAGADGRCQSLASAVG